MQWHPTPPIPTRAAAPPPRALTLTLSLTLTLTQTPTLTFILTLTLTHNAQLCHTLLIAADPLQFIFLVVIGIATQDRVEA